MGVVVQFQGYKDRKAAELATYPALECPKCDALCAPHKVDDLQAVHYRCAGNGHRAHTWRIAEDGVMLSGAKGNREYRI